MGRFASAPAEEGQGRFAVTGTGRFAGGPASSPVSTGWGKVTGFVGSAIESFPELFGIEPSEATQAFRAAAPVSGFISQMVGMGGAYGVAAKGIRSVPALAGIVDRAPAFFNVADRPVRAMAARWATEAAMIETGRLAVSATPLPGAVFGKEREQSLASMAGDAGINIVAGGALGGVVGAITSRTARGPKVWDWVPEAHPSQPLVVRARALRDAVEVGGRQLPDGTLAPFSEDVTRELRFQYEQLKRANFADIEPTYTPTGHARLEPDFGASPNYRPGQKIVGTLEDDVIPRTGRSYTEAINTLMNPTKNVGRQGETRLLTVDSEKGFASQKELDDALTRIGLDKDTQALVGQNQRVVRVNTGTGDPKAAQNAAQAIENTFTGRRPGTIRGTNPISRVANDWFVAREADNGMWVAAKKIKGNVGKAAPGDEWFVMRTDTPDVLDPQAVRFRETTVDRSAYWPTREQPNIGVGRWDLANTFERELGAMQFVPKGMRPTVNALKAMGRDVSSDMLAYVTPLVGLMGRSNRANYIGNLLKTLTDNEEAVIGRLLHGTRVMKPGESAAKATLGLAEESTGGLADFYKTLDPEDWDDVQSMLELRIPYEQLRDLAAAGQVRPKAYEVLSGLENISRGNVEEIARLKEIVGAPNAEALVKDFSARKGHYGLSENRDGGFYAFLDDERTGELRAIVAGNTAGEARQKAVDLAIKEGKRGVTLRYAGMADDLLKDEGRLQQFRAAIRKPGFTRPRGDLLGAEIGNGRLDSEKFTKLVERNLRARERFKTNVVLQEKTWYSMQRLRAEDPTVHAQMEKRLAILQGDEGKFAEFQNRAVDKVLGSVLGRDSASAIVRGTQQALNAFQFGFGNLAHYVLNAISMFQTTFPEAAFVMRTAGTDLSNYITVPLVDSGGKIVDSVNVLSDVKLFGNALKRVFGPADDPAWSALVQDMMQQGIIAPRYAEAHIGATGQIVKDVRGAFENGRSFLKWAGAVNEIGLAKSEEFNRLVGVATAYELGKALNITDPFRLARFTREFLSKTAFNYTTVDRPTIFTTPLGSLMGTFKTWMFHYMVNMGKYVNGATQSRELLAPLLWQTAATAAIGGTAATPLIAPMADAASKWFTDKSFMQSLYGGLFTDNEQVNDGILYGLPGVLGLSLAAQASTPGSDPERDANMLWSFAVYDRMRALGRALGDGVTAWKATGVGPWEDDRTRDELVRALAPRTLYRAMSVSEDSAIRSLNTGYRVLDNVSVGDSLLYSMGFNPVDLDKAYEAYGAIRKEQTKKRERTGELGRQLADAWTDGDDVMASRVFTSAMALGIDTASVMRSAKSRMERGEQTQLDFVLDNDKTGQAAEDWGFVLEDGDGQ
jgi:hypothetical protein